MGQDGESVVLSRPWKQPHPDPTLFQMVCHVENYRRRYGWGIKSGVRRRKTGAAFHASSPLPRRLARMSSIGCCSQNFKSWLYFTSEDREHVWAGIRTSFPRTAWNLRTGQMDLSGCWAAALLARSPPPPPPTRPSLQSANIQTMFRSCAHARAHVRV
jgi:hypothetical protein